MSSHTPGPWLAEGEAGTHDGGSSRQHPCFLGRITAANGQSIVSTHCLLGVQGKTPSEAEANARLIAAAPKLLEACKILVAWAKGNNLIGHTNEPPGIDDAIAAISKAECCAA